MPTLPLACLALLLPLASYAADGCDPAGSLTESNACLRQDLAATESRVERAYNAVLARTPAAQRATVERWQALWQADREPRCHDATRGFTAEQQPSQYLSCLSSITRLRAEELEGRLPGQR